MAASPGVAPPAMPQKRALVTGVGRRAGIGACVADRMRADGWSVFTSGWRSYDERMAWGADETAIADVEVDLANPEAPAKLFADLGSYGPLSALIMCHCESVDSSIESTTVESFDRHFAVNARATWLLMQAFARQFIGDSGRIIAITSDHIAFNLPYGASKGAMDRIVLAGATEFAARGITANVINPGATDNGWMSDEIRAEALQRNLAGRVSTTTDTANLVSFLVSPEGGWINGQLLYSNGGLRA